ncbi:hypothetical protein [Ligilactobacillus equi]|uniref:Uncharacterized protein n=1 Tax=Ligilactobacillus equi DSM 15833 = JCM 10991 TaxID=1423740 RepID=A0A0R1TDK1_9LACO|nr:hypothetical protein [Ligilactobacillus equi]KRL79216.1 hypothetical protein FC36_GL000869 [Ligilactobacillus equi DSM 15833 = JCM 10991]
MQKNAVMVAPSAWLVVKKTKIKDSWLTEYEFTSHWSDYPETRTMRDDSNPEKRQTIFTKKELDLLMRDPEININWHCAIVDVSDELEYFK